MNKLIIVMVLVFSFVTSDVCAKKKFYKWVDADGNVTYSDQVPPEQIEKGHEELNDQAVVLDKIEKAKTKEELQAMRDAEKALLKAQKVADDKEKKRKNIIKAYTNEEEIIRLKAERLEGLQKNIRIAEQSMGFQKDSKSQLLSIAADSERNGKEISQTLKTRITDVENKIEHNIKYIKVKKAEIIKVMARYDNDLIVYRKAVGTPTPVVIKQ